MNWTKVSEQKPIVGVYVLVAILHRYESGRWKWSYTTAYQAADGQWIDGDHGLMEPEYWMPIEPPQIPEV